MDLGAQRRALDHEWLLARADLLAIAGGSGGALLGDGQIDDMHHHRLTLFAGESDGGGRGIGRRRDDGTGRAG